MTSDSFDFDQSESTENTGGGWLNKPGTYHFIVTDLDPNPTSKDHKPIDGLKLQCECLDGTNADQKQKTFETTLFKGRSSDKDQGEFARKKLTRLFLALGLIAEHKPGQKAQIPSLSVGKGRQFVAKVQFQKDSTKFLEIAYADIFHVDDEEAKDCPKNAEALSLIPSELRKKKVETPVGELVDC